MTTRLAEIWDRTLAVIGSEDPSPSLDGWLRTVRPLALYDNLVVLACPNDFARQWLEQRCESTLRRALSDVVDREMTVSFVTNAAPDTASEADLEIIQEIQPRTLAGGGRSTSGPGTATTRRMTQSNGDGSPAPWRTLSARYTFEGFVVGSSNRFAHAAAKAVAESPAKVYNPLFIYGGVGLGKTHLLQAIAHHVVARNPKARVAYVSSEAFTNELIASIQSGATGAFRARYRNADLLLVDDVQFLAGKEATQEEFFHTFNALHEAARQIVLTSDRPPKDILTLEERLRSRFEWGLIADIQPPDFETRVAILRKKARTDGLDVPSDILHLIASKFDSNIRELEGALVRVVAMSSLADSGLNSDLAARALRDIAPASRPRQTTMQVIMRTVADYYRLSVDELVARGRAKAVAFPRQIAMYLARELTDQSLPKIGTAFGGRDHTTVLHACEKVKLEMDRDATVYGVVRDLLDKVRSQ